MDAHDTLELLEDDSEHPLLEAAPPAYSRGTVRRAFAVWMCCGRQNDFKDVCWYYHHLQALEEKLPDSDREANNQLELNLHCSDPPTSLYLERNYPNLYPRSTVDYIHQLAALKQTNKINLQELSNLKYQNSVYRDLSDPPASSYLEKNHPNLYLRSTVDYLHQLAALKQANKVNLTEFSDLKGQNGVTREEILETSLLIKTYCRINLIPLNHFLTEFNDYATKQNLRNTIQNVTKFIKQKVASKKNKNTSTVEDCLNDKEDCDKVLNGKTDLDFNNNRDGLNLIPILRV